MIKSARALLAVTLVSLLAPVPSRAELHALPGIDFAIWSGSLPIDPTNSSRGPDRIDGEVSEVSESNFAEPASWAVALSALLFWTMSATARRKSRGAVIAALRPLPRVFE
jgi:hypothetical protein